MIEAGGVIWPYRVSGRSGAQLWRQSPVLIPRERSPSGDASLPQTVEPRRRATNFTVGDLPQTRQGRMMASRRTSREFDAMNTTTKSNPSRAGSVDLATRKFSKARSIAERLGICPRTIFRWADAGKINRHKINARVVLFDEKEVIGLIESARVH